MFSLSIQHHSTAGASLNISGSFELLDVYDEHRSVTWSTVPRDDIIVNDENNFHPYSINNDNDQYETPSLEIRKPFDLLGNDLQIVVTPSNQKLHIKQIYSQITENIVPIFIYIIDQEKLLDSDVEELRLFRKVATNEPILFIPMDQTDS